MEIGFRMSNISANAQIACEVDEVFWRRGCYISGWMKAIKNAESEMGKAKWGMGNVLLAKLFGES